MVDGRPVIGSILETRIPVRLALGFALSLSLRSLEKDKDSESKGANLTRDSGPDNKSQETPDTKATVPFRCGQFVSGCLLVALIMGLSLIFYTQEKIRDVLSGYYSRLLQQIN